MEWVGLKKPWERENYIDEDYGPCFVIRFIRQNWWQDVSVTVYVQEDVFFEMYIN